jgi:hypothetical protein
VNTSPLFYCTRPPAHGRDTQKECVCAHTHARKHKHARTHSLSSRLCGNVQRRCTAPPAASTSERQHRARGSESVEGDAWARTTKRPPLASNLPTFNSGACHTLAFARSRFCASSLSWALGSGRPAICAATADCDVSMLFSWLRKCCAVCFASESAIPSDCVCRLVQPQILTRAVLEGAAVFRGRCAPAYFVARLTCRSRFSPSRSDASLSTPFILFS